MNPSHASHRPIEGDIGFTEFVALVASIMAINALAIDTMLPALPAVASAFQIGNANHAQWVISYYLIGFACGQLIYGPVSDRFGRRKILLGCLATYGVLCLFAGFATSFSGLLLTRCLQGLACAGTRVLSVAIVRDRYSGATMARVMSLSFIVFLTVPILAPSIGQLILKIAPWTGIFYFLSAFALLVFVWAYFRLRESLHPEYRRTISPHSVTQAWGAVLGNRVSLGYTVAVTLMFGALFGFINSIQQIYSDVFRAPQRFPIMFAIAAGTMAVGALLNSRIVVAMGMRRVSHTAVICFVCFAGVHALIALMGRETEMTFIGFQACIMGTFALAASNFSSIAMEPLGAIAGSASSSQGFITSLGGALLGLAVGQQFDRSTVPMALGFFVFGAMALTVVLITESGRLFAQPQAVRGR
jgi:MFS transporter, DHA1 family, multidrug resistance protein